MQTQTVFEIVTHSPEETLAFGRGLAKELAPPCLVLLQGELGSGKTTLIKGIAAGLGAAREEEVSSPTFTLVHEYAGRQGGEPEGNRVYHVDLYRIEDPRELATLGLDDILASRATVLIEWGEKFPGPGSGSWVGIRLEHLGRDDRRIVVERLEA